MFFLLNVPQSETIGSQNWFQTLCDSVNRVNKDAVIECYSSIVSEDDHNVFDDDDDVMFV